MILRISSAVAPAATPAASDPCHHQGLTLTPMCIAALAADVSFCVLYNRMYGDRAMTAAVACFS